MKQKYILWGKAFINAACRIQEIVHLEDGETDDSWKSSRIMREMVEAIRVVANGNKDSEAIAGISPRAFSAVVVTHLDQPVTYDAVGARNLRILIEAFLRKQLQGEGFLGSSRDVSQAARSLAKQVGIQIIQARSLAEQARTRAEKTTDDDEIPVTDPPVVVGDDSVDDERKGADHRRSTFF